MPKILNSYSKGVVLPPEGSDEWFALLPGWQGWIYDDEAFLWANPTSGIGNVSITIDYYLEWWNGRGIPCASANRLSFKANEISYLANGTPYVSLVCDGRPMCYGSCYIFRGYRDPGDSNNQTSFYAIGWSTSLEPQV